MSNIEKKSLESTSSEYSRVVEEWKDLRAEINRKQEFAQKLILAASVGNFTIMAFAVEKTTPAGLVIALLPAIITTVTVVEVLSFVYSGFRIAKYIQEEIEPRIGVMRWENWLADLRKHHTMPADKYKVFAWTFYLLSLMTALAKIFVEQSLGSKSMLYSILAVTLFWSLWVLFSVFYTGKIRGQIQELHKGCLKD